MFKELKRKRINRILLLPVIIILCFSCRFPGVEKGTQLIMEEMEYYRWEDGADFTAFINQYDNNQLEIVSLDKVQHSSYVMRFLIKNTTGYENWVCYNLAGETSRPGGIYRREKNQGEVMPQEINLDFIPDGSSLYSVRTAVNQELQIGVTYEYFFINESKNEFPFELSWRNEAEFHRVRKSTDLFIGFSYGIMILIFVLSLTCAVFFKKRIFLLFAAFVLMSMLRFLVGDGIFTFITGIRAGNLLLSIIGALSAITYISFSIDFLGIYPSKKKLTLLISAAGVIYCIIAVLGGIRPDLVSGILPTIIMMIAITCTIPVILVYAVFRATRHNDKAALLYLISSTIVVITVFLQEILILYFTQTMIGTFFIRIGLSVMCSTMPVAVFYQIHNIRSEKDRFKEEMINNIERVINLKQMDSLKNDLIATIAHEYRSPLSGIVNLTDSELLKDVPLERQTKILSTIHQTADKLQKNTDKFLDLIKLNESGLWIAFQNLDIRQKVNEIIDFFRDLSVSGKIEIINKIPQEKPLVISTDEKKFEEILSNVFSNALKSVSPENGIITVESCSDEKNVTLIISDNGVGIQKEHQKEIFEKFWSAGQKKYTQGKGLGLYHARLMMEKLNGQIWVESEGPGQGASFYLKFEKKTEVKRNPSILNE